MIIAIDGPAASGKGTIARALADHFKLDYLDTGLLYRAVGAAALENGVDLGDVAAVTELAARLSMIDLNQPGLRTGEVGEAASRVAAIPQVREKLLAFQRRFAKNPSGAVLDGRDIGTVIAPEAEVKIFVTATPEARADRRHRELAGRGEPVTYEQVLADILRRDERDSGRASAPLIRAADAVVLDNTALDRNASITRALEIVAARTGR
jgi:cytidylate kinase